ncbi:hypothetical protein TcasGA2_TC006123 [Tribolium castaneum]|uniref:Thioester reductase (TE) domain-containing protein n=1 Tax=Tribolium castaneum TaxID=7070 RepID=D6WUH2_TRICA|nr:hypothetical protein TcasGA2_TC006123 [Tribolium castaneum]
MHQKCVTDPKLPNIYVFTQTIAEDLVKSEEKNLPLAIIRPAIEKFKELIVSCAWDYPTTKIVWYCGFL